MEKDISNHKEDEDMEATIEKTKDNKKVSLQDKLNYITSKASSVKTVKGRIKLNPNNPQHKAWYEDDSYTNR